MSNGMMTWRMENPELSKKLFDEVDSLMGRELLSTYYLCMDLWALYADKHWDSGKRDPQWYTACALTMIYKAGYIQGIRQERKRRRKEA